MSRHLIENFFAKLKQFCDAPMREWLIGLTKYFTFYNEEQSHQALGHQTPQTVYPNATGGGALLIDKCRVCWTPGQSLSRWTKNYFQVMQTSVFKAWWPALIAELVDSPPRSLCLLILFGA